MSVGGARTHGNYCDVGMDRIQESIAAAGRAAVMTNLENIGPELRAVLSQQPVLLRALRVANEQKAHHPVAHQGDRAGQVGILEPDGPRANRSQEGDAYSIEQYGIVRMKAIP